MIAAPHPLARTTALPSSRPLSLPSRRTMLHGLVAAAAAVALAGWLATLAGVGAADPLQVPARLAAPSTTAPSVLATTGSPEVREPAPAPAPAPSPMP